jgi:hypothetical protein
MDICTELDKAYTFYNDGKHGEAFATAHEALSLIVASRRTKDMHADELNHVKLLIGLCELSYDRLDRAAEYFIDCTIPSEESETKLIFSWTKIATLAALVILGSSKANRSQILETLTDSRKSCCKAHFDTDPFPSLRKMGKDLSECAFKNAIQGLDLVLGDDNVSCVFNEETRNTIRQRFTDFCLEQMVTCFQAVAFQDLQDELGISEGGLIQRLETLIASETGALRLYRIDMRDSRVVRVGEPSHLRTALRNIDAAADNIRVIQLRKCVAAYDLRVGS